MIMEKYHRNKKYSKLIIKIGICKTNLYELKRGLSVKYSLTYNVPEKWRLPKNSKRFRNP